MPDNLPQFAEVTFPALIDRDLDPRWPLGVYAQCLVLSRFRMLLEQRSAVWENAGPDPVHAIRVAARRCRTALVTFRDIWDNYEAKHFNRLLSDFATAFNLARDLDVMIIYLEGRMAEEPGDSTQAYQWLVDRNREARWEVQPGLEQVLADFEDAGAPREVVEFFSRYPYNLWEWGGVDG